MTAAPARVQGIPAPVQLVDVIAPDDVWNTAWGTHPAALVDPSEDRARCYHCGASLRWRVVVKGADGKHHIVGRSCAGTISRSLVGLVNLAATRAEQRSATEQGRLAALPALVDFLAAHRDALTAQPHPMRDRAKWAKALTMADYAAWWIDNTKARGEDIDRALAACQRSVGVKTKADLAREAAEAADAARKAAEATALSDEARAYLSGMIGKVNHVISVMWETEGLAQEHRDVLRDRVIIYVAALDMSKAGDSELVEVGLDFYKRLGERA